MVKFFKKYHKWIGLISLFFILIFAISGVLLNHRKGISGLDISRSFLPEKYQLKNWNNGAVKGSLKLSQDSILLYGTSGTWLTNQSVSDLRDFHKGMKEGIENRSLHNLIKVEGEIFGVSSYHFYHFDRNHDKWQDYTPKITTESAFTDLCTKQDTLFVVTRSQIFKSSPPYKKFEQISLPAGENYSPKVSLFKTMWILHSGEIFGLPGKLVVDFLAIIIMVITLTGVGLTVFRKIIRHRKKRRQEIQTLKKTWKFSLKWHNKMGYSMFFLLVFVVTTGTFLRPPLLIPIVRAKVTSIPYSTLDSDNPWYEKLRVLRYDIYQKRFLLYTSDGFYEFKNFTQTPQPITQKPPVSVMGVTVLKQKSKTDWLVGSFSGLFLWNAQTGVTRDAFSGKIYQPKKSFRPSFDNPINGYSDDFNSGEIAFDYNKGAISLDNKTPFATMPTLFRNLPMPLWNVALELHVGRMYTFGGGVAVLFVFGSGLLFLFVLISGYVVHRKCHKKRKKRG